MTTPTKSDCFYIAAKERGAEHPAIPTWANDSVNPAGLAEEYMPVSSRKVAGVPGGFQLFNVLSEAECERLIRLTEQIGFLEDAAVSLPRSVRHNHSVTWVVDDETTYRIWQRCAKAINAITAKYHQTNALGLNGRFRFYRYQQEDYFAPHTDGSWPGSRMINKQLVSNAYADRWSELSFLLFLSDGYEGGRTQFYIDKDSGLPAQNGADVELISVRTPIGGVLCFPHGMHPLHCLHSSEKIISGAKYIIRSDVLFSTD